MIRRRAVFAMYSMLRKQYTCLVRSIQGRLIQKVCFSPLSGFSENTSFRFGNTVKQDTNFSNSIVAYKNYNIFGYKVNVFSIVDWHADLKEKYTWPDMHYIMLDYRAAYRPQNYDKHFEIKFPLELNRFHHFLYIAQCYAKSNTSEEKDILKQIVKTQILDWISKNPYGYGVNWFCAMDVAIRAINWIWTFKTIFTDCNEDDYMFRERFLSSLYLHGKYIERNLEAHPLHPTNHYISDLVGLLCIGLFLQSNRSRMWVDFARKELVSEMQRQVYTDGSDYEASTAYHMLVLELFYLTALLCKQNGVFLPKVFWTKLEKMFYFVLGIVKDDGTFPQIGDNDSGKILPFSARKPLDCSYILAVGAVLFENPDFAIHEFGYSSEVECLFNSDSERLWNKLSKLGRITSTNLPSCRFADAGLYIMRSKNNYMCISCGTNGQNGNGGHSHNDKLSFELRINGEDIFVDPGTYVYTSDYIERNLFRSTAYHNTIRLDGKEINEFEEFELFRMKGQGKGVEVTWASDEEFDLFVGQHDGYMRLSPPVIHRRSILFIKSTLQWVIFDEVFYTSGTHERTHTIETNYHLSSTVNAITLENVRIQMSKKNRIIQELRSKIQFPDHLLSCEAQISTDKRLVRLYLSESKLDDFTIHDGWISKSYRQREKAYILTIRNKTQLPFHRVTLIEGL